MGDSWDLYGIPGWGSGRKTTVLRGGGHNEWSLDINKQTKLVKRWRWGR